MAHRFPARIACPATAPGRIWLTGARLLDGTGSALRENAPIPVEDGLVRRVADDTERGPAGARPAGARPADVGQRVLMPGLTGAHTHASGRVPPEALGLDEHIGTVTDGKLADLTMVDGDPLAEPGLFSDPARIWLALRQGTPVAGQALVNQVTS